MTYRCLKIKNNKIKFSYKIQTKVKILILLAFNKDANIMQFKI